MKKNLNIGFIGIGGRGRGLLKSVVLESEGVTVIAVCDAYADRAEEGAKYVVEAGQKEPFCTTNYKEVLEVEGLDAIFIATDWTTHVPIACEAMEKGIAVGMEVGGACALEECWDLVNTYERTGTPFMMLENCCFGKREMMALQMVKEGLFGEVVHCSGGYCHDLRTEVADGKEKRHYRLRHYTCRNAENYPTHEIGPIAKLLHINTGNRMISLTSTASKAAGLHEFIKNHRSDNEKLMNTVFNQGDIVSTVIKCANGETIAITLDTTLPRYYSRGFTVRGTLGMYEEATDSVFLDREEDIKLDFTWRKERCGNAEQYEEKYLHPVWKKYIADGVRGTHDGMDWLEFQTFFDCLRDNKPMPVDVYDAASWMCITTLSEQSIATGSAPVAIPDFTRGKWVNRTRHEMF